MWTVFFSIDDDEGWSCLFLRFRTVGRDFADSALITSEVNCGVGIGEAIDILFTGSSSSVFAVGSSERFVFSLLFAWLMMDGVAKLKFDEEFWSCSAFSSDSSVF